MLFHILSFLVFPWNVDCAFVEELTSEEIQILATYMKCEWLNRSIMTWENVKPLYEERDFSGESS